jgi:AraC family transcriptional activator of pobA
VAIKTTYKLFIEKYIKNLPAGFKWQTTPLQMYPLEFISNYLILPTPLLKADYHFIVYINAGRFDHQIGIENYTVHAPSVLFVPEGEAFSIKSKQNELSGFFISLENKSVSPSVSNIELSELIMIDTVISLDADNNRWLDTICNLLYKEVTSDKPNRKIGTGLLQALLHKLIALSGNKKVISRQNEIANSYKQLVNKFFKEHKSVEFYARELNVTENYLNRCVKAQYNKRCKQVIRETSILQSQILMFNSTKDIYEICLEVGYDDPSYFSRVFKEVTGHTPSDFKKRIMHVLS